MSETTTVEPVLPATHHVVERLWQLYSHDLSAVRETMPDDDGSFRRGRLPAYLDDPDRAGYLVRCEAGLSGFVLVRGLSGQHRVLGEFFVVRSVRRRGVGRAAAHQVLGRHPGRWEIAFQEDNRSAAAFWRQVARDLVGIRWSEERRSVPDKPDVPPDTWLSLTVPEK